MGYVIRMPQLGMSMEEGTVVEWAVEEGGEVVEEETVVVVESEKTTSDVEAREDGVLRRIVAPAGTTLEPGDAIGIVAGPEEDLSAYEAQVDVDIDAGAAASADEGAQAASDSGGRDAVERVERESAEAAADVRATPGARKLASEEGVDLAAVEGTGPQGVVTEDDVEAAAESAETSAEPVRATPGARKLAEETGVDLASVEGTGPQGVVTEDDVEAAESGTGGPATRTVVETRELSGMQRTISERLSQSDREAVHVTLNREYDTTTVRNVVAAAEAAGAGVSISDLLVKAAAVALGEHPAFNATFEDGEHRLVEEVNVGVAVDVEAGLVTPVLANADEKSAETVNRERGDLTEKVQSGTFTMDDLEGGTFTISNLGLFGVDHFDPVINPPQVAILGVGRIRDDDTMTLSLSFDHRVVNGADAARFLDTLVETLTDEAALRGMFDADVGESAEAPRTVHVRTESGFRGSYRNAGTTVPFDEPESMGGEGAGPNPVAHLLGALGSCLSLSVREMARRDEVDVGTIETAVEGSPDHGPLESVDVTLTFETDADASDLDRVLTKAERACYVARSFSDDLDVAVGWERA
ncbi:MAG: 2-oxo acid dehydrogenase subunit E2 [Haloarculaceae archaeon]